MNIVVGDEHTDVFPFQLEDDALDVLDSNRVDTSERLVKKHKLWVDGQGTSNLGAPTLSAGELYALAFPNMLQTKLVQKSFQLIASLRLFHSRLELHDGIDVVFHAHLPKHRGFLRQIADAFLGSLIHRQVGNVLIFKENLARIGFDKAHHHIKSGRFARAVGTKQTHNLPLLHLNVNIIDHGALAVFLHQMFCPQYH